MSKSGYVRVVHDLELLCSSFCDRTTALIPTGINKVYCYCYCYPYKMGCFLSCCPRLHRSDPLTQSKGKLKNWKEQVAGMGSGNRGVVKMWVVQWLGLSHSAVYQFSLYSHHFPLLSRLNATCHCWWRQWRFRVCCCCCCRHCSPAPLRLPPPPLCSFVFFFFFFLLVVVLLTPSPSFGFASTCLLSILLKNIIYI